VKALIETDYATSKIGQISTLNKFVDERMFKLKNFLNAYDDELNSGKKQEIKGSVNELLMIKSILENMR